MGSVCYGGKIKATFPEKKQNQYDEGYPFKVPDVTLDGYVDDYLTRWFYSSACDSVIIRRDEEVIEYSKKSYCKVYVNDKDGERLCDFNEVPKDYIWDQTTDIVDVDDYFVKEYDLKNHKVKKYKMVLDKEENMTEYELKQYCDYKGDLPFPKTMGPLSDEQIQALINNKEIK